LLILDAVELTAQRCLGRSPARSCRFHSASAQLYANRAVPQARAK
jgi:hypothetical protein